MFFHKRKRKRLNRSLAPGDEHHGDEKRPCAPEVAKSNHVRTAHRDAESLIDASGVGTADIEANARFD